MKNAAEQALAERFPGQAFDVQWFAFSESLHVRWFAGPTDYAVGQAVKRVIPAGAPLVLARWWDAETLAGVLEPLARAYRVDTPAVVTWTTAEGIERASVPAGCPGYESFVNALAMTDLCAPAPATAPEPARSNVLASYYVAGDEAIGGIVKLEIVEAGGRRALRFSAKPAASVIDAVSGILAGHWNKWRKVWETGADVNRIRRAIPEAA